MAKIKNPFMSFDARGKLGKWLRVLPRHGSPIVQAKAEPPDIKSLAQLSWRHMYQKAVALWHALSASEKQEWESQARRKHMTGFAWFMSQALRPNPGLYLPLQGGTMQGEIDMATNKISDVPDPVAGQDADTKTARDAAIAAALAGSLHCDIYGYDGANWQTLRVYSPTRHSLRVIIMDPFDTVLFTRALAADNLSNPTTAQVNALLTGYNGSQWDRLRTYGTGILKVGRAEIGLLTLRRTGTGQVKASSGALYWMNLNPSAGNSAIELSDDLDGSTAIVLDHFDTNRDGHLIPFDPPMEFSTGIYLKTVTNMTSITFGYK